MNKKHGMFNTPTWRSWFGMVARCKYPNLPYWKNYGGRGIKVCKRWEKFVNFLADMGVRPEGKTLDRKNNNGNYCRRNCRWATWEEQNNNRRLFDRKNEKHPLAKLTNSEVQQIRDAKGYFTARELGVLYNCCNQHICRIWLGQRRLVE